MMDKVKNNVEFRNNIIAELNCMRKNPKAYADKIKSYIQYFKGKVLRLPGITGLMTNEGESAFREASEFLEKAEPVKQFRYNPGLTHVAHDFMKEIEQYEDLDEAKKIDIQAIIDKYGYFSGEYKHSTDFGSSTPEMIALTLVVDDGDKEREMRKVIFSDRYCEIGVSTGHHHTYNYCTVLLFTNKFISNTKDGQNPTAEVKKEIIDISKGLKDKALEDKQEDEEDIEDDNDFTIPEGVTKLEKQEKIIIEKGKKKKLIKMIYYKEDGTKQVETMKENLIEI